MNLYWILTSCHKEGWFIMGQSFNETAHRDGEGMRLVSVGQTRDGKQEWITPTAFWELDDATGIYMPPGASPSPRKPRVEATLTGQIQGLSTDVKPTLGPDDRASFFEWDTETLYYWDGSQWAVTE